MPTFCAPHQSRNICNMKEIDVDLETYYLFVSFIHISMLLSISFAPFWCVAKCWPHWPVTSNWRLWCYRGVRVVHHTYIPDQSTPITPCKHPAFLLPLRCDWSYKTLCIWTLGAGTLLLIKQTRAPALQLRLMAVLAIADQAFYLCFNTLSKMTFLEDFHEIHWHKNIKIKGQ